jgi:hypothetical protein
MWLPPDRRSTSQPCDCRPQLKQRRNIDPDRQHTL